MVRHGFFCDESPEGAKAAWDLISTEVTTRNAETILNFLRTFEYILEKLIGILHA